MAQNPDDVNGQPLPGTFMEWAVGKQGEMMRPNSGKLMLPGSKIVWTSTTRTVAKTSPTRWSSAYFYPKGQEPKFRQVLHLMGGTNGSGSGGNSLGSAVDIRPTPSRRPSAISCCARTAVSRASSRTCTCGKAMAMEAILPNGQIQVLSHVADFNFNWHNTYVYKETMAPLLPKGTLIKVTAWHDNTANKKSNPIRMCGSAMAIAR